MMRSAIEFRNVAFVYSNGTIGLDGVNIKIEERKKVVLLGANGSGKTTLLLHLNGLYTPTNGGVAIFDEPINAENIDSIRTKVGMIFQNPDDQLFAPTVYQDIAFGPRNLGIAEPHIKERVDEVLDLLNITHLRDRPPDSLSGGEKRRVALAGVLVMDAEIIALDEPHSGLDPRGSLEFNDVLDELYSKGRTIIVATHDVEFAAAWADELIVLQKGKVVGQGSPEEVFSNVEMMRSTNLKLPLFLSVYNELQLRNFVFKRDESPLDLMDLVQKVEAPYIKFLANSKGLRKGMRVALDYSGDSWVVSPEGRGDGEVLTRNDTASVFELQGDAGLKRGDITIFKVHDNERYDERVAERVKQLIDANERIKTGAMGTNAKLLAKHQEIAVDFGTDVINKSISYASRGYDVIVLASGNMAEHAGKKIYRIRPDLFFHYVNTKDDEGE